jgi:HAMP domain-containing protein
MRPTMNALVAAAAVVLAGCAASPLERARFDSNKGGLIETYPVQIVSVDGLSVTAPSAILAPGLRKVTVQMPAAAGFKAGEVRTIDLEVKACTRYWLVATRDARVGGDYDVKVDHEKRDHGCARTTAAR